MLTPEEHTLRLQAVPVDHLLRLIELEALKHYDGHWTILSFTTGYKIGFGTPALRFTLRFGNDGPGVDQMPSYRGLKDALIAVLVFGHSFYDDPRLPSPPPEER